MILLNGNPIKFGLYPNNETLLDGASLEKWRESHEMVFSYRGDQDLIRLMLVKGHLGDRPVDLTIRYMPYSRMDRAEGNSVFTLKYVAAFINTLNFRSVTVEEPHSDVTCALLDRSVARYPTMDLLPEVTERMGFHPSFDYLVFPDAGAQKRYSSLVGYKTAVGFKHRDFATGKLTGKMDIIGFTPNATPTKALILDDLCSRGGTFVMAAAKLRELGAAYVYLFVTHCEDAMWTGNLLDCVDGLYCTDSMPMGNVHSKVHVYSEGKWS